MSGAADPAILFKHDLDASRLYDLDATAINKLGHLQNMLAAQTGGVWLAAPRPWVRRLLEQMCHRGTFIVHSTLADAIAQINPGHGPAGGPEHT